MFTAKQEELTDQLGRTHKIRLERHPQTYSVYYIIDDSITYQKHEVSDVKAEQHYQLVAKMIKQIQKINPFKNEQTKS